MFAMTFAMANENSSSKAIQDRIKPIGSVYLSTDQQNSSSVTVSPAAATRNGEQIYQQFCATCHGIGLAGAPKFGDNAAWALRTKQGMNVLIQHVIQGYKLMPPKGTCMDCSDDEIKAAVEYIVQQKK
jgi:cytochrome c5